MFLFLLGTASLQPRLIKFTTYSLVETVATIRQIEPPQTLQAYLSIGSLLLRLLLADNNAHPNPASSLQNEVLGIGLDGKGLGLVDWSGLEVELFW